nr:hypothetical protein [uncultured Flavobacterium sp.]
MKEKILIYDRSLGYAIYLDKILKENYETKLITKNLILNKLDIFYFDTIIFMINEIEDIHLFSKIYASSKGINLFLGITQKKFTEHLKNLNDVHYINMELNKTDIVKFINKQLNGYQIKNKQHNGFI